MFLCSCKQTGLHQRNSCLHQQLSLRIRKKTYRLMNLSLAITSKRVRVTFHVCSSDFGSLSFTNVTMFAVDLYPSKKVARRVFSPLWLIAQKQLESCVVQELHLGERRLLLLVLVICSGCFGVTFVLGVCRSNSFCALQAFRRSFLHHLHPQSAGGMQLKRHVLLLLRKSGRPGQSPS